MKKMSLQWRLTIITTLLIAMICGSLTIFIYKNGVYYIDSLQNTVDAKSEDNNEKNPDEIYISIPDEEWNNFAKNFSIQVYNNKADYKKSSLLFSTLLSLLGGVITFFISGHALKPLCDFSKKIEEVQARLGKLVLVEEVADNLQKAADYMGNGLTGWVLKHLEKSHEGLEIKEIIRSKLQRREKAQEMTGVFAAGCGFYKLFWLFFLGSFLGDITETIFCWWKMGTITSRSSVVYGPFSLVWGIGCFFLTYMLYQYRDRSDSFIFIFGTVLGGAYEYICSVVLELVFGTVFWDYSKIPFNLGGRINLLYCFFWGIAAVVWMKILYPKLSGFIEKIPKKIGVPLTWFLVVFMVFDMAISGLALNRYHERHQSAKTPETAITKILDTRFPDTRMERIYPSAKHVR